MSLDATVIIPWQEIITQTSAMIITHKNSAFPQPVAPSMLYKFSRTKANDGVRLDVFGCYCHHSLARNHNSN